MSKEFKNYMQYRSGLFRNQYVFIDDEDCSIYNILNKYGVNKVKFIQDMFHKDYPGLLFSFMSCRKKDSVELEESIFPQLDKLLVLKYGNLYTNFKNLTFDFLEKKLGGEEDL